MRLHFFITSKQKKKNKKNPKNKKIPECKVGIFFSMQKSLSEINLSPSLSITSTWEMFPHQSVLQKMVLHSVLDHFLKGFMSQLGLLFGKIFKNWRCECTKIPLRYGNSLCFNCIQAWEAVKTIIVIVNAFIPQRRSHFLCFYCIQAREAIK